MRRFSGFLTLATAMSLVFAAPAMAAAPADGVVVEGVSVPGVALGDARSEVAARIGAPNWCQDVDLTGDQAVCSFPIDGGGSVFLRFRGPDGSYAAGTGTDVVYQASWNGSTWWNAAEIAWTTQAGVSSALALEDREAAAAAYPNAEVTRNAQGVIERVEDAQQGIRISWSFDTYTHTTGVSFLIYAPRPPAPGGEISMRVDSLELTATKERGKRHILAVLRVLDERGLPVSGAQVPVTWTYPWGATQTITYNFTSETGYVVREINDAQRGTWTFTVDDVNLDGYVLDRDASTLGATIHVK